MFHWETPAGTVHAIGEGIVLYEIQQSSDLTYRFYDWGRTDAQGRPRELHIQRSLDVSKLDIQPGAAVPSSCKLQDGKGELESLLDTPYFSLQRLRNAQDALLPEDPRRFTALTAIQPGSLHWEGGYLNLSAGQTALLPARSLPLRYTGALALLGKPGVSDTKQKR